MPSLDTIPARRRHAPPAGARLAAALLLAAAWTAGCQAQTAEELGDAANPPSQLLPVEGLAYEIGFQHISFSWSPAVGASSYRLQMSGGGSAEFSTVAGAAALEGTSHRMPFRYWDIDWGGTRFRLQACSPPPVSCMTMATASPSVEDAKKAARPVAVSLAALVPSAERPAERNELRKDAEFLAGSQIGIWTGYTTPHFEFSYRHLGQFHDMIALSADKGTLALLSGGGPHTWNSVTIHARSSKGWSAEMAVSREPLPQLVSGRPDRLLPLYPHHSSLRADPCEANGRRAFCAHRHGWPARLPRHARLLDKITDIRDIALSADGDTLAAGMPTASARPPEMFISPDIRAILNSGAVVVFFRDKNGWRHQELLRPPVVEAGARFGAAIAMSADGNTLFAAAPRETAGPGRGGQSPYAERTALEAGAVYQFVRSGGRWRRSARLAAPIPRPLERLGYSLALSADGRTLAAGTDSRSAVRIRNLVKKHLDADKRIPDEPAPGGAVHIFRKQGGEWVHSAVIRPDHPDPGEGFGASVSLSADGAALAVGAPDKHPFGQGLRAGFPSAARGAAYVFELASDRWTQKSLIAQPQPDLVFFGLKVSLDKSARTLFVRAIDQAGSPRPRDSGPANGLWNLVGSEISDILYYAY